jgi:putative endonuclease
MQKGGFIYIMTNRHHTVLYTGVTNDIKRRMDERITILNPKSFTAQ